MAGWPSPTPCHAMPGEHMQEAQRDVITPPATDLSVISCYFFGCLLRASTHPGKLALIWGGARSSPDTPSLEKKKKKKKKSSGSSGSACQGKLGKAKLAPSCHRLSPAKSPATSAARTGHGSLSQRLHLRKPPLLVHTPGKGTIIPSNSIPAFLHPPTHRFAAQKAANNPSGRELCCNQGLHAMSKALITTVILEA